MNRAEISALRDYGGFEHMSDTQLEDLWTTFSNIQCANWLLVGPDEVTRFRLWLRTGNDDDAWS